MKTKNLFLTVVLATISTFSFSQTLWSPSGSIGSIVGSAKVGVGSQGNTPQYTFHVSDVGRTFMAIGGNSTSSGAVGDIMLKTKDGIYLNGSMYWDWSFRTDLWSGNVGDLVLYTYSTTGGYTAPIIAQTDGDLALCAGSASILRRGNVGIGTASPIVKLHVAGASYFTQAMSIGTTKLNNSLLAVAGKISAEEVEVSLETAWPDYVFKEQYHLQPLSEVEAFIAKNNHLPNVPSEKEVAEDGINLGEMDAILLRKIEELTLYMIALKKENDKLKSIVQNK